MPSVAAMSSMLTLAYVRAANSAIAWASSASRREKGSSPAAWRGSRLPVNCDGSGAEITRQLRRAISAECSAGGSSAWW
jgi:hypothetical protein